MFLRCSRVNSCPQTSAFWTKMFSSYFSRSGDVSAVSRNTVGCLEFTQGDGLFCQWWQPQVWLIWRCSRLRYQVLLLSSQIILFEHAIFEEVCRLGLDFLFLRQLIVVANSVVCYRLSCRINTISLPLIATEMLNGDFLSLQTRGTHPTPSSESTRRCCFWFHNWQHYMF